MIQGFNSQLIANDVGTDITASGRAELPDLCLLRERLSPIALDQNFSNQGSMNYVNMSVPSDMPMSALFVHESPLDRNFYSTVSLPQTIVSSIDVLTTTACLTRSSRKNPYLLSMCTRGITYWIRVHVFVCVKGRHSPLPNLFLLRQRGWVASHRTGCDASGGFRDGDPGQPLHHSGEDGQAARTEESEAHLFYTFF